MTERQQAYWNGLRRNRWQGRLDHLSGGTPSEPLILDYGVISQWLRDHRAEYDNATETIKACMVNFGLHRRHRKLVWSVYSRTDFSHLKSRGN